MHCINTPYQHTYQRTLSSFLSPTLRFADETFVVKDAMETKQAEAEKRQEERREKKKLADAKLRAGGRSAQVLVTATRDINY